MEYSEDAKMQLEQIEELWQDQRTNFPSVGFTFPCSIDYYCYLDESGLEKWIGRFKEVIDALKNNIDQAAKALDWCYMLTPEKFDELLTIIPWILTVRKGVLFLNNGQEQMKFNYGLSGLTRDGAKELLIEQIHCFRQQAYYLRETIKAIEFITSSQPKPEPFISFEKDTYTDGEIVVGFYDYYKYISPYLLVVSDASIGTYHMAVRPLTDDELEQSPVNLPTFKNRDWMKRASHDWVMPLESFQYYAERPGLVDKHIGILTRSQFRIPIGLEVLSRYFSHM